VITTSLTNLAAIRHPVLLAPMGGVAGGRLAAAVSDAGGLGLVGGGYGEPIWLARELAAAGRSRVGVGFITFALDARPDSLRLALEHGPVAVQLSFGDPTPYVDLIHNAGALLISQIQTVGEAVRAAESGANVIVAQGQDSGGHGRPGRGTFGLVPAVVDAVGPVPVVAAGGIADGRGLVAALALGASGIALGTRFYAATEAISDGAARRLLESAGADDTVRTSAFDVLRGPAWPEGYDGRALRYTIVERWDDDTAGDAERAALAGVYREAADDDYTVRALWAGEGLDLIHAVEPAAAVLDRLIGDASALMAGASRYLTT
jgi:nitronate monooxygenase